MSTLKVDTLQTTGGAGLYPAKAWVNFNGTGTVAIRADGNVSSITDNGTGTYTLNFASSISDADYAANITANMIDTGSTVSVGTFQYYNDNSTNPASTSNLRVASRGTGGAATPADVAFYHATVTK